MSPHFAIALGHVATGPKHTDRALAQIVVVDDQLNSTCFHVSVSGPAGSTTQITSCLQPITGIALRDVEQGQSFTSAVNKLRSKLGKDAVLIGQSIRETATTLRLEAGRDYEDLIDFDEEFCYQDPHFLSRSYFELRHLATLSGIDVGTLLGAEADALIMAKLYKRFCQEGPLPREDRAIAQEKLHQALSRDPSTVEEIDSSDNISKLRLRALSTRPDATKADLLGHKYDGVCLTSRPSRCVCQSPETFNRRAEIMASDAPRASSADGGKKKGRRTLTAPAPVETAPPVVRVGNQMSRPVPAKTVQQQPSAPSPDPSKRPQPSPPPKAVAQAPGKQMPKKGMPAQPARQGPPGPAPGKMWMPPMPPPWMQGMPPNQPMVGLPPPPPPLGNPAAMAGAGAAGGQMTPQLYQQMLMAYHELAMQHIARTQNPGQAMGGNQLGGPSQQGFPQQQQGGRYDVGGHYGGQQQSSHEGQSFTVSSSSGGGEGGPQREQISSMLEAVFRDEHRTPPPSASSGSNLDPTAAAWMSRGNQPPYMWGWGGGAGYPPQQYPGYGAGGIPPTRSGTSNTPNPENQQSGGDKGTGEGGPSW